ncbi:phage integrase domain/SAM domain-containing protein [Mycobacteroides abscessus subsp. bolletii]|nr:phage integrase domain/SAM domain-containing protein [Mycobacteroides abscessus subsp. bolletii]SLD78203.1 phage integrase domain/SAM domain-containing protein [Mycobacteroides abscessus subsp. bolletii]SLD85662.1 phage integrase domain/SAM domain-containing protein [Mycobacteroides abscessus subsp. bolletii]
MGKLWSVHWVSDVVASVAGDPVVAGWSDLLARERAAKIGAGDPFMVDPQGRVDARLSRYFTRSGFARLAESTKISYTNDYRVFFNFLWIRGTYWDAATSDDLLDFQDWRRESPDNPVRVSGAKWNRELAALQRLYRWAERDGYVDANPVLTKTIRDRYGNLAEVPEAYATDVRSSNVRWLTPRAFRSWRDVGLRGYDAEGRRDGSFRGRHDDRNAAFADVLFSSGLRRTEAGSLLTIELPRLLGDPQRYYDARLAAATAKYGKSRTFYLSLAALRAVAAYCATSRRAVIRRAQVAGRYEHLDRVRVITGRSGRTRTILQWRDENGVAGQALVDALRPRERLELFIEGPTGLEPLWLWLGQDGTPFEPHSWEAVFRSGSKRCLNVLGRKMAHPPFATPHMCRHSFALHMLVALHHVMDNRFGLTAEQRRDFHQLYGDPWRMVKDLLGHADEQVTRDVYLAPVSDLQVRSLLLDDGDPDVGELLSRIAAVSERVLDTDEMGTGEVNP